LLNRVVAHFDFPKQPNGQTVKRLTFNPKDNNQVVTTGHNHWKMWRLQENTFKPLPQAQKIPQNHSYTDHIWVDEDKVAATTSEGEIFIIEGTDIKQYIENAFNTLTGDEEIDITGITCIREFSKGFFVASDNGHMAMWVRSDENNSTSGKQAFDFIRKWCPASTKGIKILGMSVSPGEDFLAVSLANNNIGLLHIKTLGLNEDINRDIKFDLVCRGFHSGSIDSVDIAVQRPIIVTASKEDSTIRIWNYYTH